MMSVVLVCPKEFHAMKDATIDRTSGLFEFTLIIENTNEKA